MFWLYLKAIEIQGFKSFAQKTRLTFEKDITAIVGPNGSGKSNISDAMRWVMGEQSTKALRGGKMEDVIFGGTEKRSPLGFAEVSLILDNSGHIFDTEASEVMITRRYYRSGDSEYYINKKSCRLKDVNELLMDTGLGREGYSIIGQGRIDEILSIKSTDRRDIFEEAAGISRFRHRKEESQHKLQQAEDNLLRINDKISELEMQVGPLKEQSETAKKYLILRDELRGIEISAWMDDLEQYDRRAEKYRVDYENVCAESQEAKRELELFYEKSEEIAERTRQKDIESEKVRDEITRAGNDKNEAENAAAVLKATVEANVANIERIEDELKSQEGRSGSLEEQIARHMERIHGGESELEENGKAVEALNALAEELSIDSEGAQAHLGALLKRENELLAEKAADSSRYDFVRDNVQREKERLEELKLTARSADEKLTEAKERQNQTEEELKKVQDDLKSSENIINGYKMRLQSRESRAEKLQKEASGIEMEYRAMKSRISLLEEMEKDYAGYSRAVKTVMQESARGILKGVCGTVGQIAKADDDCALAIETALGAAMQNIIVETEEDGKSAINFLKRRDGGRATFMPVSTMRGTTLTENLENEPGFEGLGSDLVSFDKKYSGIFLYLLGRTAVTDNIDNAIRLGRKYKNRFRIVTLDGQVVNAGGSMTGGSSSKNAGILSRANELESLKKEETAMKTELEKTVLAAQSATRELETVRREIDLAGREKRNLEDSLLKLEASIEQCRLISENCRMAADSIKEETASVNEKLLSEERELSEIEEKLKKAQAELDEIREKSEESSAGYENLVNKITENRERRDEILRRSTGIETEIATLSDAVLNLQNLMKDLAGGSMRQREMIENLKAENEKLKEQISEKLSQAEAYEAMGERLRGELSRIAGEKMDLESERAKRDRDLQDMNSRILSLERESGNLEQMRLSAELSAKQIIDKLWDTYELSRSAAKEQARELDDKPAAQRRIGELKREISKLGSPNIGAIEEYERVNGRYTYLTDQRDDIEKSRSELNMIIDDITSEMTKIFAEKFKEIDSSFRSTFTELFGGGRAALELEDENDILNCGIEIKVQPPGKALKTITLLSGGEKAFVAIALYFAILKVRPTPFVFMDEIDSALDEANNSRFAEYMRTMTDRTQFLVITHRRRTMEEADVLYGVTMQEKGVSQVIDIDLDEAEKTIMD